LGEAADGSSRSRLGGGSHRGGGASGEEVQKKPVPAPTVGSHEKMRDEEGDKGE
jgi:hypothetical protein